MGTLTPSSVLPLQPSPVGWGGGGREKEKPPTVHLPYVISVSERIRRVCRDFNIRAAFKSGSTLYSLLTKVKDSLHREKQANVVYKCHAPAEGCTSVRLHSGLKHDLRSLNTCIKGFADKSAIAEHA